MHRPAFHARESGDRALAAATSLLDAARRGEAIDLLRDAVTESPKDVRLRNMLGVLAYEAGHLVEAESLLADLVARDPRGATPRLNLANVLVAQGRATEAIEHLERAQLLEPAATDIAYALGRAYQLSGRPSAAIATYERVLAVEPNHALARTSLAAAYGFIGEHAIAEREARTAISANPTDAGAHFNLAVALLSQQKWADGWAEHEWRERAGLAGAARTNLTMPRWTNESIADRRVLVYAEQGYGDTIQFVRYLPALRALGATVIFECPSALVPLIANAGLADEVYASGGSIPHADLCVSLLSLPRALGVVSATDSRAAAVPYLAPASVVAPHAAPGRLRVGLVWAGSATHVNDLHRSCGLSSLAPLLKRGDVDWISLQTGPRSGDIAALGLADQIADAGTTVRDFADTAAIIAGLDLVITVDSAVAHLAGAMDVPCALLLPRIGLDWRWAGATRLTPLYESVHCFRQDVPDDWDRVVASLHAHLDAMPRARRVEHLSMRAAAAA